MKFPDDKVTYVDRLEVLETFVDSLGRSSFHNGLAFLELCVTRVEKVEPPNPPTARRYPAARLVMTPQAIIDLFQTLQNVMAVMHKEGIIKQPDEKPKAAH